MNTKNAVTATRRSLEREKKREKTRRDVKEKGETVKVLTKISEETIKLLGW